MKFETPLEEGLFLKRYKRFFADIEVNGKIEVAHVANTGSLKSVAISGAPCLFSRSQDPNRKLKFSLEAIKPESSWVGINTSWPNKLGPELFTSKTFSHWSAFDRIQPEVKISDESRIDLVLWNSKNLSQPISKEKIGLKDLESQSAFHLVEIKNVTLLNEKVAQFPDAVTERGQKHLRELMNYLDRGMTCELLFVIQRTDCESFSPAKEIDPEYAALLSQAQKKGLVITPAVFAVSNSEVRFIKTIPTNL